MILGRDAILEYLESGAIVCTPRPDENQIQGTSIDVRLGHNFWIQKVSWYGAERLVDKDLPGPWYQPVVVEDPNSYFYLEPSNTVLAHTEEFIGTTVPWLTTKIHTRSTPARWGVDVCKGAGFGDPGFCGRWTLELTNTTPWTIALPIGCRIAQIAFFEVKGNESDLYDRMYNQGPDEWTPNHMLPKLLQRD